MIAAAAEGILHRAVIEYDGTDLLGFQIQANGRTVQGELERALQRLTQSFVRVTGAGRTDAGVHARGQVVSFRVSWKHAITDLHRGLNALLPSDIVVRSLDLAPDGFEPRFSAVERWYRYQIGAWPGHSPLLARYAWEPGADLDVEAMDAAAAHLVGSHDFASFGQPPQGEISTRTVFAACCYRHPPYVYFDIRANAFLRHMVRNLTGALVQVGLGQLSPDDVATVLSSRDRSRSAPPAPPQGLILMAVTYPPDHELAHPRSRDA